MSRQAFTSVNERPLVSAIGPAMRPPVNIPVYTELPSNAVEYLQNTVSELQEEASFLQSTMEAYHNGMMTLLEKNKGLDVEAINKKNLREKGVPLESLKTSRTEKLDLQANTEAMKRAEKRLADSQEKYSTAVAQVCELQNRVSSSDYHLKQAKMELEEKSKAEKMLRSKCVSLAAQLEEESSRSSEALRELQLSQGSKDDQIDGLIKSIQSRLDSKSNQCRELEEKLARSQIERAESENEVKDLKKRMLTQEEEAGKKLELTLSDVEKMQMSISTR